MNRDVPIQVKEQKQTKNKNKFHRIEDAKKFLKELKEDIKKKFQ